MGNLRHSLTLQSTVTLDTASHCRAWVTFMMQVIKNRGGGKKEKQEVLKMKKKIKRQKIILEFYAAIQT